MAAVCLLDGRRVSEEHALISPLGSAAMFGYGVLDRLRAFRGRDGRVRIVGLEQHLERTLATAQLLYGEDSLPQGLLAQWRQWIIGAVQAAELEAAYLHLGFGPYASSGTMLQNAQAGLTTFIFVKEEPPLYGKELVVSSETEFPRPAGPLASHKAHGPYADLLLLKGRARTRCPQHVPKGVEALLFPAQCFDFWRDCGAGQWRLREQDPEVAEFGCSNAFALDRYGDLHLAAPWVVCFRGVTVRIVEELFRARFPRNLVRSDLRRSHLGHDGGSAGTAGGVVPVVKVDGEVCPAHTEQFGTLVQLYQQLCQGTLNDTAFQEQWAPIVA